MKKILFYAVAAFMALTTGCSKNPEIDGSDGTDCKYTLPAISATLDSEQAQTRTELGNNQVVNWSAKDRIAVINTKTNQKYQYEVISGIGTPVGHFEPVGSPAAYDDINDLKAVYPSIAASVSGGVISLEINKEWSEEERKNNGIISWGKDSPYSFTYNDIKVSYNTLTVPSNNDPVNFKFRQLGTWCTFDFDFTGTEYAREYMQAIEVTTKEGTKKISGKAEINFADPAAPVLKQGDKNAVLWTFNAASVLSAPINRSLMLFPGIDGDQMKITVKTDLHTFTFYATPKQPLTPGTILRFPIQIGQNFSQGDLMADFTYTVEEADNIKPFYYYGTSNCLLLAAGTASGNFDITPYKADPFYGRANESASEAPKATKAKIIWRETTLTLSEPSVSDNTLNISGVSGSGNALVGIYDEGNNLLWSYHVWCPEVDPTQGLLTYPITNSGSYQVMPLFLGGTVKPAPNEIKAAGLWYEWGRKDPMGRTAAFSGVSNAAVNVPEKSLASSTSFFSGLSDGTDNVVDVADVLTSYDEARDGAMDRYMIDYATQNPTVYITDKASSYRYWWCGKANDNLWSNPLGYQYPRPSSLPKKSAFDPCPKGYRVAPRDLWINFSTTGMSSLSKEEINASNVESFSEDYGYYFYYEDIKSGQTDFYPTAGSRNYNTGRIDNAGIAGATWSSSPYSQNNGGTKLDFDKNMARPNTSNAPTTGFTVRCVRDYQDE